MSVSTPRATLELELEPGTLVLGDLHLDVSPQGGEHAAFGDWLTALVDVPRLIVLGDLFDAWVGAAHLELAPARAVVDALRACTRSGTAIDVIPGNRDFLLDERFEAASGARVCPDGLLGRTPDGRRVLFVHGDELCTLDRGYQRLKRVVRSPAFGTFARHVPRPLALWLARSLRSTSRRAVAAKPDAAKMQQPGAALELARSAGADELVCGHAHQFRSERLGPSGTIWWVLDAWGGQRDLLRLPPAGGGGSTFEVLSTGVAGPPQAV